MKTKNTKQIAIIILLAVNLIFTVSFVVVPKVSAATGCFPDTNGHWAETFICWMSDTGLTGGYPDGTYKPERNVTRAEMAVFMKNLYDAQNSRIADLEATLASVSLENGGDDVVFTGVNVHVRDGSDDTDGAVNGLGNLIIGYNEDDGGDAARTGSHNLVIGPEHSYMSYGGLVAGYENTIIGEYSSVSGGSLNTASDIYTTVSSGSGNTASGHGSSVSGGRDNTASGNNSSISGGANNTASGSRSSVSGGGNITASGSYSSASGGWFVVASGDGSSVSGGYYNTASGNYSTIGGGANRSIIDNYSWRAGGLFETQ